MLVGLAVLFAFQLAGEIASYFLGGFIPGAVIGMAAIAAALTITRNKPSFRAVRERVSQSSDALLAHLGILFVPAGVGIVRHIDLIQERPFALAMTILLSTVMTLVVTVWVFLIAKRLLAKDDDD
jgi:holin-like protein